MPFHIAAAARTTGNLLQELVTQKLAETNTPMPDVHICYGVGYTGSGKKLNGGCSLHNKQDQARILREGLGPGALEVFEDAGGAERYLSTAGGVLLARKAVHTKGKDIRMAVEPWQVQPYLQSGSTFFTKYEPSVREFRTWVYRKRHLGTYEKVLRRPQDCKRLGRNYDNGFDFSGIDNDRVPQGIKDVARSAIAVLGLDFGAVDVLERPDGSYCVLEVNSAPGVSGERRKVIQNLAHRVARWIVNGCPEREVANGRA